MTSTQPHPAPPFPVHPRAAGDPEPDLTGFVLIHRALRSGTRLVADVCGDIAGGDPCPPARHTDLVWFAEHVLTEIHAHHEKEDDVLWPVIVASAGDHVDLDPLTEDHRALAGLLDRADAALAAFRSDPTRVHALGEVMGEVADELDEHIAEEERTVFPVMRTFVSAGDFARCEKLFQKGAPLPHVAFILPWVVDGCTASERAQLMPGAPLPVRVILRLAGPRWARRAAVVRGARSAVAS